MAENVITVENISKSFKQTKAVSELSFEVEQMSCFGFLGPNGAGKTTMMKMLYNKCTRDKNCHGQISVFGYDPSRNELEIKYLSGVVPQDNNLDDELNVIQNLMIYSKFYNIPSRTARQRIGTLLEFLELSEKTKSKITELSGGMKRRLVIARALLNNPKLLILDEPTTGLDPQVRHLIWDKLRQLKKQGTTILLTTHYMEEAFAICDTVLIMHKGSKVMEGQPHNLLEKHIEKYVLELRNAEVLKDIFSSTLPEYARVDRSSEVTRIFSNNIEYLRTVATSFEGGHYYLRQANLEDVFLKATGRALDDKQ
ncbi:MAG: ABC transporter ATP-binding protein [Planctomycetota bacterium]|nr:ABC transporter ATP-binding protein [Planctomycetota bacterium]